MRHYKQYLRHSRRKKDIHCSLHEELAGLSYWLGYATGRELGTANEYLRRMFRDKAFQHIRETRQVRAKINRVRWKGR